MNDERMKVLTMLEEGKINAEEAASLLEALAKSGKPKEGPFESFDAENIRAHVSPILDRVVQTLDQIPEKVNSEHLPKLGKGIGRVVDTLSGFLNQGLGFLDSRFQPTFSFEQSYDWSDLGGIAEFEVHNTIGHVRMIGENRTDVLIRARITIPAESQKLAELFLATNPVELRREGFNLFLAPPPSLRHERLFGIFQRHRFDFECHVPKALVPQVNCISGDASLQDAEFTGTGKLKSISGDLEVSNVAGTLELNTISGDIACDSFRGECEARTVSGDVEVKNSDLAGHLTTVSGEIEIEGRLRGGLVAKTISGDVSLRLEAAAPLSAATTSGDIECELRHGSTGYLDASSRTGDVRVDVPLDESITGKRHIKGKLAGGSHPLTLATVSGDVEIKGV